MHTHTQTQTKDLFTKECLQLNSYFWFSEFQSFKENLGTCFQIYIFCNFRLKLISH